jgi:hypothetical protein
MCWYDISPRILHIRRPPSLPPSIVLRPLPSPIDFYEFDGYLVCDDFLLFVADFAYPCETSFEGGGWLRVRFQPSTSNWHPASDFLRGFEVYGDPNAWNAYSIYFQHLVGSETEFLFSLGIFSVAVVLFRWFTVDFVHHEEFPNSILLLALVHLLFYISVNCRLRLLSILYLTCTCIFSC